VSWFFDFRRDALAEARKSRFPLATGPTASLPPEPRLEQLDRLSNSQQPTVQAQLRARIELLNRYGATADNQLIHIPIDRAMELLAGKLPARTEVSRAYGVTGADIVGLLGGAFGPLLAAQALLPERTEAVLASFHRRENGLLNGGASNSGRLFNRRAP